MKKILLLIVLTLGLTGADSPYLGGAISASNADGSLVSCRAATTIVGGVKFSNSDFTFSIEGRSMNSMNASYASTAFYVKPEYKGFYALVGYGRTTYTEHDLLFTGARYGLGYDFGYKLKHMFVDVIYNEDERDWIVTTGFNYMFEGF